MKSLFLSIAIMFTSVSGMAVQNCNPTMTQLQNISWLGAEHLYSLISGELQNMGAVLAANPEASLTLQFNPDTNLHEALFLKFELADGTKLRAEFKNGKSLIKVVPVYDKFGNIKICNVAIISNSISNLYNNETQYRILFPSVGFGDKSFYTFGPN